jgi:putative hydrolase of the HAD superfamily
VEKRQSPKRYYRPGFSFFLFCIVDWVFLVAFGWRMCDNVLKVHAVPFGTGVWLSLRVKAVLFDMFDTLMMIEKDHAFYSPALRAAYGFLAENGVSVSFEEFSRVYVEARDALYAKADVNLEEPHFNVRISDALKRLGYEYGVSDGLVVGATDAFCEAFMKYVNIDENAERILQKLHGKYKLGIVSNFAIPECVTKLLEKEGLTGFFDVVVVSGAVNKRKPSVEIFTKALEQLGVKAQDAVFVGDTVDADVQGAKAAGMRTIYIERRLQKDAEAACPDQTIKNLNQLSKTIERC